jgi:Virulence-associated protein E
VPTRPLPAVLLDLAGYCLKVWLPSGVFREDGHFLARSLSGDAGTGLEVDTRTGFWFDDESSQSGHGLVELYAAVKGCTIAAAESELTAEFLQPSKTNGHDRKRLVEGLLEMPGDEEIAAPEPSQAVVREISATFPVFADKHEAWIHFGLKTSPSGQPWANLDAALAVISQHPDTATALWFDEFKNRVMFGEQEFDEYDASELCLMMQRNVHIAKMTTAAAREAAETHAKRNARHPVREWLRSRPKWNGLKHLEELMPVGFGTVDDDYHAQVGRCFLIGMVARVMKPGVKVDTLPVFEGPESIFKTTALKELAKPWFLSNNESIQSKDFLQNLSGYWLVEIAEMQSFSGAQQERIKAIISDPDDVYRASYGHYSRAHPRQSVFAGTTNDADWNHSSTGARRFWPISCGEIDRAWIIRMRDALFAEALHRYEAGENWWEVPRTRALEEQALRHTADPWLEKLAAALELTESTSVSACFDTLQVKSQEQTRKDALRIASILRQLGWKVRVERVGHAVLRIYRRG